MHPIEGVYLSGAVFLVWNLAPTIFLGNIFLFC